MCLERQRFYQQLSFANNVVDGSLLLRLFEKAIAVPSTLTMPVPICHQNELPNRTGIDSARNLASNHEYSAWLKTDSGTRKPYFTATCHMPRVRFEIKNQQNTQTLEHNKPNNVCSGYILQCNDFFHSIIVSIVLRNLKIRLCKVKRRTLRLVNSTLQAQVFLSYHLGPLAIAI